VLQKHLSGRVEEAGLDQAFMDIQADEAYHVAHESTPRQDRGLIRVAARGRGVRVFDTTLAWRHKGRSAPTSSSSQLNRVGRSGAQI
jgi:hypothetical protein